MKFYLFKRLRPKPARKEEKTSETTDFSKNTKSEEAPFIGSHFTCISHDDEFVKISYDFYSPQHGVVTISGEIKVEPWTFYAIELRNNFSFPPRLAFLNKTGVADCSLKYVGPDVRCYLGSILFTDTEALMYLCHYEYNMKGGMTHDGFELVEMNDTESSSGAFARFSEKARTVIEVTDAGRKILETTDYIGTITALTAQVDLLTQILINSGIVKDSTKLEELKNLSFQTPELTYDVLLRKKRALYKDLTKLLEAEKGIKAPRVDPETFGQIPFEETKTLS